MMILRRFKPSQTGLSEGVFVALITVILSILLLSFVRNSADLTGARQAFDARWLHVAPTLRAYPPARWVMDRDCRALLAAGDQAKTVRNLFAPYVLNDRQNLAGPCEILRDTAFADTSTFYRPETTSSPPSALHRALLIGVLSTSTVIVPVILAVLVIVAGGLTVRRSMLQSPDWQQAMFACSITLILLAAGSISYSAMFGTLLIAAVLLILRHDTDDRGAKLLIAASVGACLALLDDRSGVFVAGFAIFGAWLALQGKGADDGPSIMIAFLGAGIAASIVTIAGEIFTRGIPVSQGLLMVLGHFSDLALLLQNDGADRTEFIDRASRRIASDSWGLWLLAPAFVMFINIFVATWAAVGSRDESRDRVIMCAAWLSLPVALWLALNPVRLLEASGHYSLLLALLGLAAVINLYAAFAMRPGAAMATRPPHRLPAE